MASMLGVAGLVLAIVYFGFFVLSIAACVKIISKAGYSGWWILIAFVPAVNVVMFFVFAFSEWPILRQSRPALQEPSWPTSPREGSTDIT